MDGLIPKLLALAIPATLLWLVWPELRAFVAKTWRAFRVTHAERKQRKEGSQC